jgi:hypothetical protein
MRVHFEIKSIYLWGNEWKRFPTGLWALGKDPFRYRCRSSCQQNWLADWQVLGIWTCLRDRGLPACSFFWGALQISPDFKVQMNDQQNWKFGKLRRVRGVKPYLEQAFFQSYYTHSNFAYHRSNTYQDPIRVSYPAYSIQRQKNIGLEYGLTSCMSCNDAPNPLVMAQCRLGTWRSRLESGPKPIRYRAS